MPSSGASERVPIVILCGGRGTRMGSLTHEMPKPMLPIGGRPLVYHIMRHYAAHGFSDFVLALGYLGWAFKEFFATLPLRFTDVRVSRGKAIPESDAPESMWNVVLAETGDRAETGQRLQALRAHLDGCHDFGLTYGDGLSDVDPGAVLALHRSSGRLVTVTAVHPPSRFGEVEVANHDSARITHWREKQQTGASWINGGYMFMRREALDALNGEPVLERALVALSERGEVGAYCHEGHWLCADTPRELEMMENLWEKGEAFWKPKN